jgi:hypothetical protein
MLQMKGNHMKKLWVTNAYNFRSIAHAHAVWYIFIYGVCIFFLHLNGQYMMYIHVAPLDGTSIL